MQRSRRKQEKDQRSLQENKRYQGNISCKDGHNKGQKWYDLTEAEDIKKKWQGYIEELYKKDLNDPDNYNDVITHLEPDNLGLRKSSGPQEASLRTKLVKMMEFWC